MSSALIFIYRTQTPDWIVFLPGSAPELWNFDSKGRRALLGGRPANLMIINKPGVLESGKLDEAQFERKFRRSLRVRDYAHILKGQIPGRARVFLVGYSEGAYLAPEVASRDPRVRKMALICGGTRSWLDEEIYKAHPAMLERTLRRVGGVYARPESTRLHWFGVSHATWTSYDNEKTVSALERLRIPILAIHAGRDRMIDVASAREDLLRLREQGRPIRLTMYPRADHTLGRKWVKALAAAGRFFAK